MATVRPATPEEYSLLPSIECDAAQAFLGFPELSALAQSEPLPISFYETLPPEAAVFVAEEVGALIGLAVCTIMDGHAHLKELSVRHAFARHGIGTALLQHTINWAQKQGHGFISLTTFRDIPFNAPFYAHHGFAVFAPDGAWPELSALCEKERAAFPAPRVAMRKDLASPQAASIEKRTY